MSYLGSSRQPWWRSRSRLHPRRGQQLHSYAVVTRLIILCTALRALSLCCVAARIGSPIASRFGWNRQPQQPLPSAELNLSLDCPSVDRICSRQHKRCISGRTVHATAALRAQAAPSGGCLSDNDRRPERRRRAGEHGGRRCRRGVAAAGVQGALPPAASFATHYCSISTAAARGGADLVSSRHIMPPTQNFAPARPLPCLQVTKCTRRYPRECEMGRGAKQPSECALAGASLAAGLCGVCAMLG